MLHEIINFDCKVGFIYLSTPRPMQGLNVSFSFACPAPRDATAAAALNSLKAHSTLGSDQENGLRGVIIAFGKSNH